MQTRLKAHCGCTWSAVSVNDDLSAREALTLAQEHARETGHTIRLEGEIRPEPRGYHESPRGSRTRTFYKGSTVAKGFQPS